MNKSFDQCTLLDTYTWFQKARPNPTDKDRSTQLGVHLEEVVEMLDALGADSKTLPHLMAARRNLSALAEGIKAGTMQVHVNDHNLYLDAICDQIVTATGVGYTEGYDVVGAMTEVNRSNFSKFDAEGNPIFNENKKVMKGPNYSIAVLDPYLPKK
jgi:hypothetical protein